MKDTQTEIHQMTRKATSTAAADKIAAERTARRAAKFEARQREIKEQGLEFKTIEQIDRENKEAKIERETKRSFQWDFSS
jgi:hypothetical protein